MKILTGLQVKEYSHPEENKAFQLFNKANWLKRLINWAADEQNVYELKANILGNYIRITESAMPEFYQILSEVCEVLDYSPIPQIFMCHRSNFDIGIFPGKKPLLMVPDYLIEEFNSGMLTFQVGRAISALKSDTCKVKMLAKFITLSTISLPVINMATFTILADWVRKAGLTEDRGGLLACQNINNAEKALMRITGMPDKYLTSNCIIDYIAACQKNGKLSSIGQSVQTIERTDCWNNDRIVELYKWYCSGEYDDILEDHE